MSLGVAILIHLLLLVDRAYTKKGVKCGGILSAPSGNISSPNFPGLYPYNIDCAWLIVVAEGSSVLLTFHHFELEYHASCAYDYIKIYNGISEDEGNLLGIFCGDISPPQFTSSWNVMSIIFHSDRHVAHRGFSVGYRKGECQQVLSVVSGNFTSPNFPNIYPNNINCHWSITLEAGYRIKLYFPVMDLEGRNSLSDECDYDSVSVYDGDSQADALMGRWCGREQPPSIISKGNQLLVVLSTDRNEAHRGFSASYLGVVPVNVSCTRSEFTILIPQQSLPQLDRESIYLGNPTCTAQLTTTSYKILAQFVNCGTASQKHRNITMLVNKLYIDFSDGKQQNVQEYKVQCDALRKVASVSIISAEERRLEEQALQTDSDSSAYAVEPQAEPHDLSDIVFISICVLAVILMVIAIVWLVLL
ncbi:PREDICTED: CUB domain-containing protein 2 [Cyprinodon variegatus]|uniref:CUB domain-containing protein 2 n=1 Tax=Cyprinodon variegatus TaxID=28743 RepID=UPI000742A50C|nr:PREDICTED: CUB domain-containing protein 2 [Cyprinodon variegatus]